MLQIAIFNLAATRAALVIGRVAMSDVGALSATAANTAKNGGVSSTAKSVKRRTGAVSLPGMNNNESSNGTTIPAIAGRVRP